MHDERWVAALQDCGFVVETFSRDRDGLTVARIRQALERGHGPVLAGPLDSITKEVASSSRPVVGLSWGFDLLRMHGSGADMAWMRELQGLIVDSHANRDIAVKSGVSVDQVFEIPWGIDINAFTPRGEVLDPSTFDLPASAQTILSLRALEATYRVKDIVDAFTLITHDYRDTYLLVGNDGSLRAELEAHATTSGVGDRLRFIGRFAEYDLPALLRAATVYVTASEVDGTSVTLLQAMACGTPVIASDAPGNRQWVSPDRAGRLFDTHSPESLADQLREMLDSPPGPSQRAAARDLVVEEANWSRNRAQLGSIMRGPAGHHSISF